MTVPVLVCDDSSVARKQMAQRLPEDWDIEVSFAQNGEEAVAAVEAGLAEITFLDLNMPVMDGYQALEAILEKNLQTITIVVSGDIQPEAEARVKKLGAIGFLKKPFNGNELIEFLQNYGLYQPAANTEDRPKTVESSKKALPIIENIQFTDCIQEVCNVAMGQAGDSLARLLNVFVKLPVPSVNMLEVSELQMALSLSLENSTYSAVCQGFIGSGVAGEALLIFDDSSFADMATLLNYKGELSHAVELELLMDVASILTGAFLNGFASQLDMQFSQGHPVVLGQHVYVPDLLQANASHWHKMLAIEVTYEIENYHITCDLLLLITGDSMDILNERLSFLGDGS